MLGDSLKEYVQRVVEQRLRAEICSAVESLWHAFADLHYFVNIKYDLYAKTKLKESLIVFICWTVHYGHDGWLAVFNSNQFDCPWRWFVKVFSLSGRNIVLQCIEFDPRTHFKCMKYSILDACAMCVCLGRITDIHQWIGPSGPDAIVMELQDQLENMDIENIQETIAHQHAVKWHVE